MEKWQKKIYQSSLVLKAIFNSYFCFEMWLSLCLLLVCLKRIFYFSYLFLNLKFIWILLTCPSTKIWNSPVIQDKMSLGSTIYQQKPVNCKVVQAFIFFFLCQLFALLIDLLQCCCQQFTNSLVESHDWHFAFLKTISLLQERI